MGRALKIGFVVLGLAAATPVLAMLSSRPASSVAVAATAERHPEIRAAIASLQRAKDHLQKAAHDFGGHRVDAIAAVDKAIEQLTLALKYDK